MHVSRLPLLWFTVHHLKISVLMVVDYPGAVKWGEAVRIEVFL